MSISTLALALAVAQADPTNDLERLLSENDTFMDEVFSCYDKERKSSLKANITSATAESTVADAELACGYLFERRVEEIKATSLARSALEIVNETRSSIQKSYVEITDKFLTQRDFAESRVSIASNLLGACIRGRVNSWAEQASSPEVLASAAVDSCRQEWSNLENCVGYQLRATKQTISSTDVIKSLKSKLRKEAIVWVFEARAK